MQVSFSHHTSNHTAHHSVASVPTGNLIPQSRQCYTYHHTDSHENLAVLKTFEFELQQSQKRPFRPLAEVDLLLLKPNHIPAKLVFLQKKFLWTIILFFRKELFAVWLKKRRSSFLKCSNLFFPSSNLSVIINLKSPNQFHYLKNMFFNLYLYVVCSKTKGGSKFF